MNFTKKFLINISYQSKLHNIMKLVSYQNFNWNARIFFLVWNQLVSKLNFIILVSIKFEILFNKIRLLSIGSFSSTFLGK